MKLELTSFSSSSADFNAICDFISGIVEKYDDLELDCDEELSYLFKSKRKFDVNVTYSNKSGIASNIRRYKRGPIIVFSFNDARIIEQYLNDIDKIGNQRRRIYRFRLAGTIGEFMKSIYHSGARVLLHEYRDSDKFSVYIVFSHGLFALADEISHARQALIDDTALVIKVSGSEIDIISTHYIGVITLLKYHFYHPILPAKIHPYFRHLIRLLSKPVLPPAKSNVFRDMSVLKRFIENPLFDNVLSDITGSARVDIKNAVDDLIIGYRKVTCFMTGKPLLEYNTGAFEISSPQVSVIDELVDRILAKSDDGEYLPSYSFTPQNIKNYTGTSITGGAELVYKLIRISKQPEDKYLFYISIKKDNNTGHVIYEVPRPYDDDEFCHGSNFFNYSTLVLRSMIREGAFTKKMTEGINIYFNTLLKFTTVPELTFSITAYINEFLNADFKLFKVSADDNALVLFKKSGELNDKNKTKWRIYVVRDIYPFLSVQVQMPLSVIINNKIRDASALLLEKRSAVMKEYPSIFEYYALSKR